MRKQVPINKAEAFPSPHHKMPLAGTWTTWPPSALAKIWISHWAVQFSSDLDSSRWIFRELSCWFSYWYCFAVSLQLLKKKSLLCCPYDYSPHLSSKLTSHLLIVFSTLPWWPAWSCSCRQSSEMCAATVQFLGNFKALPAFQSFCVVGHNTWKFPTTKATYKVGTEEVGILDIAELMALPAEKLLYQWTLPHRCPWCWIEPVWIEFSILWSLIS